MKKALIKLISCFIPGANNRRSFRNYFKPQVSINSKTIDEIYKNNLYYYNEEWIISKFKKEMLDIDTFNKNFDKLLKNLDKNSIDFLQNIKKRIVLLKDKKNGDILDLFNEKEKIEVKIVRDELKKIKKIGKNLYSYKNYLLPINNFEAGVFLAKHSFNKLSKKELLKLRNKDIIDVGGYIGDSALVLSEFTDAKVYSFEPSQENIDIMKKTIILNHKESSIIPVRLGLGSSKQELFVAFNGIGTAVVHDKNLSEKIQIDTLDNFVKENKIKVGAIKVDIEGAEQEFLKGALETIKSQKPALLLSIYHNTEDFFNIKSIIEDLNLGYKLRIIKQTDDYFIVDTLLIAEID